MDILLRRPFVQGRGGLCSVHSEPGGAVELGGIFLVDRPGPLPGRGGYTLVDVNGEGSTGKGAVVGALHYAWGTEMRGSDTLSIAWAEWW